jgi:hypothetical protein
MSNFVSVYLKREKSLINKFVLLLNSKKETIYNLKREMNKEESDSEGELEVLKQPSLAATKVFHDTFVFDTQLLGTAAIDDLQSSSLFQGGTQIQPSDQMPKPKPKLKESLERRDSLSDLFD